MAAKHLLWQWIFGGRNRIPSSFPRECFSGWWGKALPPFPVHCLLFQGWGTQGWDGGSAVAEMMPRCRALAALGGDRAPRSERVPVAAGDGALRCCGCDTRPRAQPGQGSGPEPVLLRGQGKGQRRCPPARSQARSPWHGPLFSASAFCLNRS